MQIFTDGSKVDEKVAAALVSYFAPSSSFSCRLRDHCSIYTAELQAILFAFKQAYQSGESKFMSFSDSLSALRALERSKSDHPLLTQIQNMLNKFEVDQKEVVFMWAPGHVGIHGNEAADRAATEALEKEPIDDLMPFSDLKPSTAKFIHRVWQKEWDEAIIVSNKLHDTNTQVLLARSLLQVKEDVIVLPATQTGGSSFFKRKERTNTSP